MKINIFTDGAYSPKTEKGGWAVYCPELRLRMCGAVKDTTNNRMEITAVIEALALLKEPCEVTLYSDSQYVCNALTKGWAKKWQANNWMRNKTDPALNPDLWERLLALYDKHNVTIVWVKGHAGHPENERCDALAVAAGAGAVASGVVLPPDAGYCPEEASLL